MTEWILRAGATDARVLCALARLRTPRLSRFMRMYTHLGDAPVPMGIVALLLLGWVPGVGVQAALVLALSFLLSQGLKRTISRPRPNLPEGLRSLIDPPDRFSFPSGHASASLAVALPLAAAFGGPVAILILALALLVGISRCYLGVHYPGDVLAGWVLALVSAFVVMGLLAG
jgi:undecaprenyl-diphosphatase